MGVIGRNLGRALWVILVIASWPMRSEAQGRTNLYVGPLVSIQPVGDGIGLPYLDNGVGGVEPGVALGLERRTAGGILLALELSTTTTMRATQSGRLVFRESGAPCGPFGSDGCGPVEATHRDTLVSALVGKRFAQGRGGFELKAGASLIVGTPKQGDFEIEDAAGSVALTAGLDVAIPLSDRVELVPSFRYSRAFRGENDFYVGLGANIFRIGLGVRMSLSGH